jgi:hypothetical protein
LDLQKVFNKKEDAIRTGYLPHEWEHRYSSKNSILGKSNFSFFNQDLVVFSGPWFSEGHSSRLLKLLSNLNRNQHYAFLSAGSMQFNRSEVKEYREILKNFPPLAISSRDRFTFENYGDLASIAHDGICSSFFLPLHFPKEKSPSDYIVFSFDHSREIPIQEVENGLLSNQGIFWRSGELSYPARIVRKFFTKSPLTLNDGTRILRTDQVPFRRISLDVDSMGPILFSADFQDYLEMYAQSKACFSSRIHAVAPSAAYQTPSIYLGNSKRSSVLERVGLNPSKLDIVSSELIDREYKLFTEFLLRVRDTTSLHA